MKLLTPLQTKDLKEQNQLREILRTQELQNAAQEARQGLAKAEADFRLTLARNREQWEKEEENHQKRLKEMENEINLLEAKRLNALIPVGIIKQGAEDRMQEAVDYLASLKEREDYNEELTEQLQDKLDKVGVKEQDIKKKELELDLRVQGIQNQELSTISNSKRLSEEIAKFAKQKEKAEKDINERKTAIFLQEQSLISKAESLKRTDKALSDLAIRLEDERNILERAWKELERRKSNIPVENNG